jgi:hexokinase
MGDAGEGLVDSEARIQERQDEIERERAERGRTETRDPAAVRAAESLRLARAELERQLSATTNDRRRSQITQALAEIDRRSAALPSSE